MSGSAEVTTLVELDPLFADPAVADDFERRGAEFGNYRLYAEHERIELDIGPGLLPRHDAVRNFLQTRVDADDSVEAVGARTSYFREEYAYGDALLLDGVEAMRDHEGCATRPFGSTAGRSSSRRSSTPICSCRARSWPSTPTCRSSAG